MKKVNSIINQYKNLSEGEKISLFLALDELDLRNHFDPSYRTYKVIVKNGNGLELMNRTFNNFFNERELRREVEMLLTYNRLYRMKVPIEISIVEL